MGARVVGGRLVAAAAQARSDAHLRAGRAGTPSPRGRATNVRNPRACAATPQENWAAATAETEAGAEGERVAARRRALQSHSGWRRGAGCTPALRPPPRVYARAPPPLAPARPPTCAAPTMRARANKPSSRREGRKQRKTRGVAGGRHLAEQRVPPFSGATRAAPHAACAALSTAATRSRARASAVHPRHCKTWGTAGVGARRHAECVRARLPEGAGTRSARCSGPVRRLASLTHQPGCARLRALTATCISRAPSKRSARARHGRRARACELHRWTPAV
jgi:hypothetical protein